MTTTTGRDDPTSPRPYPTYDELPYHVFLREHVTPNTPFLLSPRATAHWPARRQWAKPPPPNGAASLASDYAECSSAHSRSDCATDASSPVSLPNLSALRAYGDQIVPVADTARREFSEFERDERPLSEVLDLWESGEGRTLYVKDWHLVAELEQRGGTGKSVYSPPPCFLDDWLSPPFEAVAGSTARADSASTADFRFVYAGPKGTFTPLHRDVYGSYSWSANVVGRKVWWLFPPGTEPRDKHGELVFDVRGEDGAAVRILQEEGEVIFVPSGWHHQVKNVDFCISINHNFFASPTLPRVYAALRASQARCAASIEDVLGDIRQRLGDAEEDGVPLWEAEWAAEVDGLLARDAGWGWEGFWTCVRENILSPPADADHSPTQAQRDAYVRDVVDQYKTSREWALLPAARQVVADIEELINTS